MCSVGRYVCPVGYRDVRRQSDGGATLYDLAIGHTGVVHIDLDIVLAFVVGDPILIVVVDLATGHVHTVCEIELRNLEGCIGGNSIRANAIDECPVPVLPNAVQEVVLWMIGQAIHARREGGGDCGRGRVAQIEGVKAELL